MLSRYLFHHSFSIVSLQKQDFNNSDKIVVSFRAANSANFRWQICTARYLSLNSYILLQNDVSLTLQISALFIKRKLSWSCEHVLSHTLLVIKVIKWTNKPYSRSVNSQTGQLAGKLNQMILLLHTTTKSNFVCRELSRPPINQMLN